ncbi:class I SAM-dependent methyltransferase [Salinispora tropica]|uniref:Methyltransferase type 12 n=1 Tax=Salinispora tropica (strain ATCC BAA-916 / DSM 44818 / JCM 13857 / NBRC 105044 / CNB-440) TaxID=369723 RepID=A4X8A0_SALTO|nr:class I SAM-dependent methyltransferase [Salinispora tropica]ABP55100.1 Methyltransferase type 12 [Salinispora tropica CNB-440]
MDDPYAQSAEYIDLLIADAWGLFAPGLSEALHGLGDEPGVTVDLGAGTGRGVAVICASLPDSSPVLAVEPSPALRAVLLARAHEDASLRSRVTVSPADAMSVPMPEQVRVLVAMNMIGHLSPDDRRELWQRVAPRLVRGGRVVVNLAPPARPVAIPRTRMASRTVGGLTYEGWASAEAVGEHQIRWHMTYLTRSPEGAAVAEVAVNYDWWVMDEGELRAEFAEHGLTMRQIGHPDAGLYVASHVQG